MNLKLLLACLITIAVPPSMGQGHLVGSSVDTTATSIAKDETEAVVTTEGEGKDLKGRMEHIEAKSQRQEKEIEGLKTLLEEEKKFSKQLSGRILQLEASINPQSMEQDQLLRRPKRPYRLLPPYAPLERDNADGETNRQFYGPATSCVELGLLGYTLNGYYLVKKTTDLTKRGKVGIVYCQFQQLRGQNQTTTSDLFTSVGFDHSELEVHIMDLVFHKLSPIDSKIMEQTKQIKDIFAALGKLDIGSSHMESKKDDIKNFLSNPPSQSAKLTAPPSPGLMTSAISLPSLNIMTKSEAKSFYSTTSSPYENKYCTYSLHNPVKCENVSTKNIKKFFKVTYFNTNNPLGSVGLSLLKGDEFIPADIFDNKKIGHLTINYNNANGPAAVLRVDVNAFQSTKNYTKTLTLRNFNSSQLHLGFLMGFNELTELKFYDIRQIQKSLPSLPLLPNLTSLALINVRGLRDSIITFPTLSTSGLKEFTFSESGKHSNAEISRILDWILLSSAKTLQNLRMDSLGMTEIPSQISSFTALNRLDLDRNSISTIEYGALSFLASVSMLTLSNNKINSIEPGAFQGDFRDAHVYLSSNSLTRIDESVFRPVLEQMESSRKGRIYFENNKINCSTINNCHLAWLIRDRKLKGKGNWGKCSNGERFDGLSEYFGFSHCPDTSTRKPTKPYIFWDVV